MPATHRRKISRQRGSKWHGHGGKKKHRGGGSRGGRGMSGMFKHKKSWAIKYGYVYGKKGFNLPQSEQKEIKAINLQQIDAICKKENKEELDVSTLGFNKVLGGGRITQPVTIKTPSITAKAKEKIEEAGGKVVVPGSE